MFLKFSVFKEMELTFTISILNASQVQKIEWGLLLIELSTSEG